MISNPSRVWHFRRELAKAAVLGAQSLARTVSGQRVTVREAGISLPAPHTDTQSDGAVAAQTTINGD